MTQEQAEQIVETFIPPVLREGASINLGVVVAVTGALVDALCGQVERDASPEVRASIFSDLLPYAEKRLLAASS